MAPTSSKAELISFLTARGPDLLQSRGGIPTLTQHDVAAMFRHLSDKEQADLRREATEQIETSGVANPQYFVDYFGGQRAELDAARSHRERGHRAAPPVRRPAPCGRLAGLPIVRDPCR